MEDFSQGISIQMVPSIINNFLSYKQLIAKNYFFITSFCFKDTESQSFTLILKERTFLYISCYSNGFLSLKFNRKIEYADSEPFLETNTNISSYLRKLKETQKSNKWKNRRRKRQNGIDRHTKQKKYSFGIYAADLSSLIWQHYLYLGRSLTSYPGGQPIIKLVMCRRGVY